MGQIIKERLFSSIPFWLCLVSSIVLFIISLFMPPTGEIHPSVLKAVAELIGFVALSILADAIRFGYDATVTHGGTTVTIGNREEDVEVEVEEK